MEEHNQLIDAANHNTGEGTPLGLLGDWLEEHNMPGANLARGGMIGRQHGFDQPSISQVSDFSPTVLGRNHRMYFGRHTRIAKEPGVYLWVRHYKLNNAARRDESHGNHTTYRVPIHSMEHLKSLVNDFPKTTQKQLLKLAKSYNLLPTHEAKNYTRRRESLASYSNQ